MMKDQPEGAVAPAAPIVTPPAAVAPPPAPVAPAPEKPRVMASELPEDALKQRLESARAAERNALLKEIGYESIEQAKADAQARLAAAEAAKSEAQRAAEERARLVRQAEEAEALRATVVEHASRRMAALTESQRAAVKSIAGDDGRLQLRAIDALEPTWSAAAAPPAPPVVPAPAAAPVPAPAPIRNTAPQPSAPPEGGQPIAADHRGTYEQISRTNPFAAAAYATRVPNAVYIGKQ